MVRIAAGQSKPTLAVNEVVKTAKDDGKKGKDVGVAAGPQKGLRGVETSIKNVQQEMKRIERSSMPPDEKERLLRSKKLQLDRLNQQKNKLAKEKKDAVVQVADKMKPKKKSASAPVAEKGKNNRKLQQLKSELRQELRDEQANAESVRKLKNKVRQLEQKQLVHQVANLK